MRAVVEYAESDKNPLPPILARAWRCREWHCLPMAGGELDQPAGLLDKMTTAMNIYNAVKEYKAHGRRAGEMAKWRNEHPETAAMIDRLKRLGVYE